mmetsp:Transcript_177525/g.563195  ORF Transcript_177525/g.563195 Transcript_177525/m.563195 type:complete len:129 (+) Transcript_177525:758-1144(+)
MMLDSLEFKDMVAVWQRPKAGDQDSDLFDFSYEDLSQSFKKAVCQRKYDKVGIVHLYQRRYGGASHDAATRARPMAEIQRRGRWARDRSLRRYESGDRINDVHSRFRPGQLLDAVKRRRTLSVKLSTH